MSLELILKITQILTPVLIFIFGFLFLRSIEAQKTKLKGNRTLQRNGLMSFSVRVMNS